MTLDQLRIFVAVAELEHLTNAASALSLSQSAVSSAISALERRYGTRLFDRIGRSIVLSVAGHQFLGEAKAVIERVDAARQVLLDLSNLKRGTLCIGASQTVCNYWLPRLLQSFRQMYPGVDVDLRMANSAQIIQQIEDGLIEVGFVDWEIEHQGWQSQTVFTDQMELVVAPNHPWVARACPLGPDDLIKARWVSRERGSGTRALFEKTMREHGVNIDELEVSMVLPTSEGVRTAVESGVGAAMLSRLVIEPSIRSGGLIALSGWVRDRRFNMIRNPERCVSSALIALGALLNSQNSEEVVPRTLDSGRLTPRVDSLEDVS